MLCLGTLRLPLTCILQSAVQPVLCQCATVNHLNNFLRSIIYLFLKLYATPKVCSWVIQLIDSWQTGRQTDRQTDRQTNGGEKSSLPEVAEVIKLRICRINILERKQTCYLALYTMVRPIYLFIYAWVLPSEQSALVLYSWAIRCL